MTDVRIGTPRGVVLAASLTLPDDVGTLSAGGTPTNLPVVILCHDFLLDRHGADGRLDTVAASYRAAGMATLSFDFSGLGDSGDDVITLAGEVEDLRAVSGWLAEHGLRRQAVHANGFGGTVALTARPEAVGAVVVVGAVVGPQSILWEEVFSPEQLDELESHGLTRLPDDNPNARQWDVVSKETLADVSLQDPATLMAGLPWPVLMLHGALADEFPQTTAAATEGFHLLRDGSQLVQVHEEDAAAATARVAELAVPWVVRRLG